MKNKIEVEIKLLQSIATYYEFPFAVFFMNTKNFSHGKFKTRREALSKKAASFDRIKEIFEEEI